MACLLRRLEPAAFPKCIDDPRNLLRSDRTFSAEPFRLWHIAVFEQALNPPSLYADEFGDLSRRQ
ncbi:hypothetical protein [Thalassoroseus pseudoceratinae]|uniref:hypothetical protein n=1 Tax=Thalassoroseus pseudoceratinae TaxID=2713176 RepID=UPI001981E495|nr:hypothetical protein [Thalassoroseus pseudoceratinae]